MTPLPPDREAVILRELRATYTFYRDYPDADLRSIFPDTLRLCNRIWSHVESRHAAALVEARRQAHLHGARLLTNCAEAQVVPLPRPAIAPVPLSGGRTLAWNAETKEYVVTAELAGFAKWYCYPNADRLISASAPTIADARTILAFVAQVEGVAT